MTIITKPITEKKAEKLVLPPTENDQLATGDAQLIGGDTEAPQDPHFIFLRARARRVSTRTTLCLLLTALIVVSIGIICGTYLYRQYLRSQIFKGWCNFPVEQQQSESAMLLDTNFIQEEFEIDVNREEYEKINVPDFRDGRSGRFIIQEEFEIDVNREEYEKINVPDFRDGRSGRFIPGRDMPRF
ncbi:hypothetical protein QE152_g24581 [Popillia japonica]|uniref:Integral membrane protein 2 n=1 Tax=Popillia japonica TaxID=7064 RepID=A0AAW1K5Z7_POPJA